MLKTADVAALIEGDPKRAEQLIRALGNQITVRVEKREKETVKGRAFRWDALAPYVMFDPFYTRVVVVQKSKVLLSLSTQATKEVQQFRADDKSFSLFSDGSADAGKIVDKTERGVRTVTKTPSKTVRVDTYVHHFDLKMVRDVLNEAGLTSLQQVEVPQSTGSQLMTRLSSGFGGFPAMMMVTHCSEWPPEKRNAAPFRLVMTPLADGKYELVAQDYSADEIAVLGEARAAAQRINNFDFGESKAIDDYVEKVLWPKVEAARTWVTQRWMERKDKERIAALEVETRAEGVVKGRKKATGRFETRRELAEFVWSQYLGTDANLSQVARQAHVSPAVVSKIINDNEEKPDAEERDRLTNVRLGIS